MSEYHYGANPGDMGGMGGMGGGGKSSLTERLIGIITFKGPIYREIAKDQEAMLVAALILVGTAVISGFFAGLYQGVQLLSMAQSPEFRELGIDPAVFTGIGTLGLAIALALISPLFALISWLIVSALYAWIANSFFEGTTSTGEMMRVFGFTSLFSLLSIIPCVGLIGSILSIIGTVIGIREAANITTGKAVITWLIPLVALVALYCLCIAGVIFVISLGASGGP